METLTAKDMLVISKNGSTSDQIKIDYTVLKKAAMALRSINHKLRQTMIRLLDEQKRMTVTEIYDRLKLEQSVASQHLAILRRSGVVKTEREGKFIFYSVNKARLAEIARLIEELA